VPKEMQRKYRDKTHGNRIIQKKEEKMVRNSTISVNKAHKQQ
jgi:hypothetical protein